MPLKSNIPNVTRALDGACDAIAERTGKVIWDARNEKVRVDTGQLRDSAKLERQAQGEWRFSEGEGLPDARAAYTNYGTVHMAADGHMDNAAEVGRKEMPGIVRDEVKKALGGL